MHVLDNFKLVGISVLIIVGLAACDEEGATDATRNTPVTTEAARNNVQVAAVDPNQLEALKQTVMPDGMPLDDWFNQGYGVNPETRIFCKANQFGEVVLCHIDILGRRATTGEMAIPKWRLSRIRTCGEDRRFLVLNNFFGPRQPMRLFFDGDSKFIEVVGNVDSDAFFVYIQGELRDRLQGAKSVKVLHGIAATEISYVYDLSAFQNAVALADTICK